ncbi:MAG: hypothetical protein KDK76_03525 [Chlamydiia bacterium]|nr:hypothetical protein [Chlamydiia bacterium]
MGLLPVTIAFISLLEGNPDMGEGTSDTRKDILKRYIGYEIEEGSEESKTALKTEGTQEVEEDFS